MRSVHAPHTLYPLSPKVKCINLNVMRKHSIMDARSNWCDGTGKFNLIFSFVLRLFCEVYWVQRHFFLYLILINFRCDIIFFSLIENPLYIYYFTLFEVKYENIKVYRTCKFNLFKKINCTNSHKNILAKRDISFEVIFLNKLSGRFRVHLSPHRIRSITRKHSEKRHQKWPKTKFWMRNSSWKAHGRQNCNIPRYFWTCNRDECITKVHTYTHTYDHSNVNKHSFRRKQTSTPEEHVREPPRLMIDLSVSD